MYPTRAAMIRYTGKATLELLDRVAGGGFKATVENAGMALERTYPQLKEGGIQGTTPHRSSKDLSDPKDVVTVSYHTSRGTRLVSIHAHDDGTWNEYLSRAGRNPGGGCDFESSAAQDATTTNLAWKMNEQTNRAEWWDGTKWVEGDWSDECQRWYACYNGQSYYW